MDLESVATNLFSLFHYKLSPNYFVDYSGAFFVLYMSKCCEVFLILLSLKSKRVIFHILEDGFCEFLVLFYRLLSV